MKDYRKNLYEESREGNVVKLRIDGDYVEELRIICDILDMDYDGFGGAA